MKRSQTVVMRKIGGFYHVFDEDAFILFHFFHYKISNGKCGFPISTLTRVKNILEENKINYIFRTSDSEEEAGDFKKQNRYDHFYRLGKKEYEEERKKEDLQKCIKDLPKDKLDILKSCIEDIIHE